MKPLTRAYLEMSGAILLLIAGILILAVFFFPNQPWYGLSAFIITLILHLPQIPAALRAARGRGIDDRRTIVKTIFYGAAWWRNVAKGVLDR